MSQEDSLTLINLSVCNISNHQQVNIKKAINENGYIFTDNDFTFILREKRNRFKAESDCEYAYSKIAVQTAKYQKSTL